MMSSNHPIRSFALDNLLLFALGRLPALPSKQAICLTLPYMW